MSAPGSSMRRALSFAVLAALAAAPARAQQPAPRDTAPVALPEIVVIGSILPSAGPAVGSGVPARVEVIQGDELRARRPRILSDALAGSTGISLYDDLGSPFKTTLVVRGFAASPVVGLPQGVTVFLDGVPVNEPDAGQVNFDLLPLERVERVEVLSGTASLLGLNSLGGAVNLVTRRVGSGVEAEGSLGSFGAHSAAVSAGGGLPRGWSVYAGGGYADEGGWRQRTAARLGNVFASVGRSGARSGVRGDVIALGFTRTRIIEMGQPPTVQEAEPAMWVGARQYTGRIVTVTNDKIFDEPVYNYTREFPFIWEEIRVPVRYADDRVRAEAIILDAARRHTREITEQGASALNALERHYRVQAASPEPRTFLRLTDNWLEVTVRFLARDHGVRGLKDAISRDILKAFEASGIEIASATYEIVGAPVLRVARSLPDAPTPQADAR